MDATVADAPIDGNVDGSSIAAVSVVVTFHGSVTSGVNVYFQNADSTLVSHAMTGSDGSASATMDAGGFVTVIEPNDVPGGIVILDTFAGVKPGDVLHDTVAPPDPVDQPTTFNLTVPTDSTPGILSYDLFSSCGQRLGIAPSVSVSVTLHNCNGVADMLVVTRKGGSASPAIDSIYLPDQAIANGQDVTVPGTYTPVPTETIDETNLGSHIVNVSFDQAIVTPRGTLFPITNAVGTPPAGGTSTIVQPLPLTTNTTVATLSFFIPDASVFDVQEYTTSSPPPMSPVTIDYSSVQLSDYTSSPNFDATRHAFTYTISTAGMAPDFVTADVTAMRDSANWEWRIASPGSTNGTISLPALPSDVFDFTIGASDNANVRSVNGAKLSGGFDLVRGNIFDNFVGVLPPLAITSAIVQRSR